MARRIVAACAVLVFGFGLLMAAEYKGTISKVDAEKSVVKIKKGDGKEANVRVGKRIQVLGPDGKAITLKDLKEGSEVTVTYDPGDKDSTEKGKKRDRIKEIKVTK